MDILSVLVWVQSVCNVYQKRTKFVARMEIVHIYQICIIMLVNHVCSLLLYSEWTNFKVSTILSAIVFTEHQDLLDFD